MPDMGYGVGFKPNRRSVRNDADTRQRARERVPPDVPPCLFASHHLIIARAPLPLTHVVLKGHDDITLNGCAANISVNDYQRNRL
jgi:hypothetical protein